MSTPLGKMLLILLIGLFITVTAAAQADCPLVVQNALTSADQWCADTGRNQACYGNDALTAQLQPGYETTSFAQTGDIVDVIGIQGMQLSALDTTAGTWGVALFRIQANLPDTLPGQNVTMLMFGDTEIYPGDPATTDLNPMQAFYLRTGIGDAACAEVPSSGVLVQTPHGAGQISLSINDVQVQMGSTVYFQAQPGGAMTVRTIEGAARIQVGDDIETAIAGTEVDVPLDENWLPSAPPGDPESYEEETVAALPVDILEREIEIAPPLPEEQLATFLQYEEAFEAIDIEHQGELLNFLVEEQPENIEELEAFLTDELGYEAEELAGDSSSAEPASSEEMNTGGESPVEDETRTDEADPTEEIPPADDSGTGEDPEGDGGSDTSAEVAWDSDAPPDDGGDEPVDGG